MRKAFIVGIDNYEEASLNACVRDAEDVAQIIQEQEHYGFNITLCTNENATLSRLRQGLNDLFADAPEVAMFYFAGHGIITDMGAHLATYDWLKLDDPGLSLEMLNRLIQVKTRPDTSVIIILDCCHSGTYKIRSRSDILPQETWRYLSGTSVGNSISTSQGRVVLAACKPNQKAVELNKEGHGIFTYHLLDALRGEAADFDGNITPISIYEYLASILSKTKIQEPNFNGDITGQFIIGSKFPHRKQSNNKNEIQRVERKAHELMDEYLNASSRVLGDEDWKKSGFKEACSRLSVNLEWQRQKAYEIPELKSSKEFLRAMERASAELSRLGFLYSGLSTYNGSVEKMLGSGTFGTVWKMYISEEKYLAYKVYNPQDMTLEDKRTRFKRGYQAMSRLEHPQVVKVYEYTECPIGFYMDYIDGPNLRDLGSAEQNLVDILKNMLDIADTIRHAHNKGVVHRDVKPENILMQYDVRTHKWIPFLTDFDLAWFSAASQVTKLGIGAFSYAAPEQFSQPGAAISHAKTTDVYAFGQLSYFQITRDDPVPTAFEPNVTNLSKHLKEWPSGPLAQRFLELYKICTQMKPEHRVQTFDYIWRELDYIYRGMLGFHRRDKLSIEDFVYQIKFNISGLIDMSSIEAAFQSLNSQISISIQPLSIDTQNDYIDIRANLVANQGISLTNVASDKVRTIMARRIDEMLKENFPEAIRLSGRSGAHETIIQIRKLRLNSVSAVRAANIIKRVIETVE